MKIRNRKLNPIRKLKPIKIKPLIKPGRKKRKLQYIAVLPSLVTLMNGLCGFLAIILASRGPDMVWIPHLLPDVSISYFALAGYLIFLAMVADVLDGHVARISKTTSSFGAQLDSLCDAISFGAAPAFLMLKLVEIYSYRLQIGAGIFDLFFNRAVFFIAIIYAMCAVIRLARFNVENGENKDESGRISFAGLPSPAAAGAVVSMIVFQQDFLPKIADWPGGYFNFFEVATVWCLPVITLLAGLLMVTRIPYPHIVNHFLTGKKRFSTFLIVLFTLLFMIWNIQLAMVLGFCLFMLFGIVRKLLSPLLLRYKKELKQDIE